LSDPRTTIGPLARSVEDLAAVLEIITGEDGVDPSLAPVPLGDWRAVEVGELRIAMFTSFEGASCDEDTDRAVREAGRVLEDAGAAIEEAVPPRIEESLSITRSYWARPSSSVWNEWESGGRTSTLSADDVEHSIFEWERLQRSFASFMQRYDAVVCPVSPSAALRRGEDERNQQVFMYTLPFSLTGQPAVVVRGGTSSDGLPIGVQVVARKWRDDVALGIASVVEQSAGPWAMPEL
jgi:amidase